MDNRLSLKGLTWDERVLLFAVCSCFLPYYITILTMFGVFGYIIFNKKRLVSSIKGIANIFLCLFTVVSIYTALVYDNWLGMIVSFIFFGVMLVLNFSSIVCDKQFYIKLLLTVTGMSVVVSFAAFTETFIYSFITDRFRANAYCMNPNYLADLLMVSILVCAYLEMSKNAAPFYCYLVAAINCVALYLTGSMSTWVALLIGISVMLLVMRHHISLGIMFLLAATAILVLLNSPELFPRLDETAPTINIRLEIIKQVVEEIKEFPIFGKGFLSTWFSNIRAGYGNARIWHAHNLILECLISFGYVGTSLIGVTFFLIFRRLGKAYEKQGDTFGVSSFVIAVVVAAFAHAMVDMTLLWVQTGLLAAIIVGGGLGGTINSTKKAQTE